MSDEDLRRQIPQVSRLLELPEVKAAEAAHGRAAVERAVRSETARLRDFAIRGDRGAFEEAVAGIGAAIEARCADDASLSLRRLINATGVVVHTNLGRAPLSREVADHVASIASSYSNLEFDLETGERGHRETHAEGRLRRMLDVSGSVVVNNNAAAVLLMVNTFAEGREVIVSRGELVEIGGSFRIPDVIRKGGAKLREVGTTNRTRIADYEAAITGETGLILRVHPSNFRIVGFTESASLDELVAVGRQKGIVVADDLGSGLLHPLDRPLDHEATIAFSLAAGVDVVSASGDKLLGGPQAGLLAGRKEKIDALRRNPLYRALRVDKMTIAALDAVLSLHDRRAQESLPVPRMVGESVESVRARVERGLAVLRSSGLDADLGAEQVDSAAGGGAAPDIPLPSFALVVRPRSMSAADCARRLRAWNPPIVARVAGDAVWFDFRTLLQDEESEVARALVSILGPHP